ncbi:hypothetical protein EJ02DRAFT_18744 [Clathrospora elynae]|uniref:Uncharacterized protein n=1 Tax=Clathrospora elynae TaxID=706981 RepID=A0A6A5SFS2_9PLEO|nr:hypothetical protein EJ02DRAFT_18744 [Clathrospora elynae]
MKPASCPSVLFPSRCALRVLSPRVPRSSLHTLVLYYMQALRKEVVLPSTRIAKIGNLLHSTVHHQHQSASVLIDTQGEQ